MSSGDNTEQQVSTEPQRIALELMSAELVHKLNIMIAEQEERMRKFAELHHSTLPTPQAPAPVMQADLPRQQEQPVRSQSRYVTPPPPALKRPEPTLVRPSPHDETAPAASFRTGPRKKTGNEQQESNIGVGMIIFALVGIIMLLRACT